MRKRLLFSLILSYVLTIPAFTQEQLRVITDGRPIEEKIDQPEMLFKDKFFITVGSGVQLLLGEDDSKASFRRRLVYAPSISVGKYFTPKWGVRIGFTGGDLNGYNDGVSGTYRRWTKNDYYMGKGVAGSPGHPATTGAHFLTWDPQWSYMGFAENGGPNDVTLKDGEYVWQPGERGEIYKQEVRYFATNFNVMFNIFASRDEKALPRTFDLTPYIGPTFFHVFPHEGQLAYNGFGANGGLMANFRMSDHVGFFFDGSATFLPNDFDGHVSNSSSDIIIQAQAGLKFTLGEHYKKPCDPVSCDELRMLNDQVNNLRLKIDELRNRPLPPCPECPKCPGIALPTIKAPSATAKSEINLAPIKAPEPFYLPDPVFFRINKSVIDDTEWERIELAVTYLREHPNAKVEVTGHADKKTGTAKRNLQLSKERSQNVAKALVEKYGIDQSRVTVDWKGDAAQPFIQNNDWNRVVIFHIIP